MPSRTAVQIVSLLSILGIALSACASTAETLQVSSIGPGGPPPPKIEIMPVGYSLTAEEKALDCKKLKGRMQVRILQIRNFNEREQTSTVSRMIQQGAVTILGGTKEGSAPVERYARDRAVLEAYNQQLAAKGCKTFNLDEELKPKPVTETPEANQPASK